MQRSLAAVVKLVIVGFLGLMLIGTSQTAFAATKKSPGKKAITAQSTPPAGTPPAGGASPGSPSNYHPSGPPPGYNPNQPNQANDIAARDAVLKEKCKLESKGDNDKYAACYIKGAAHLSGEGNECAQHRTNLAAAKKEFDTACGKANMSMSSGGCLSQVKKCILCMGGGDEGADCGDPELDTSEVDGKIPTEELEKLRSAAISGGGYSPAFQSQLKSPNYGKIKLKYENCPAMAGTDYKTLQKEVEDGQKKVDDLELKIPQIQQEMADMRSKVDEGALKAKDKIAEAKREWQALRDKIDQEYFKDQEELQNKIKALRNEMDAKKDSITNLALSKTTKKMEREQQLSALRLKCNEIALTQIQQMRAVKAADVKVGKFTAGNFGQLMARAGRTERENYQAKADELYNNCLASNIFLEGKKTIDDAYKNALTIIDTEITKFNREIEKGQAGMDHLLATAPQQDKKEYESASLRADEDYTAKYESAVLQQQLLEREMLQRMQLKYKELEMAMRQLEREKDYLQQKQKLLALKRQFTDGDQDAKSGDISSAIALFESVKASADNLWNYCGCDDDPSTSDCRTAAGYNGKSTTKSSGDKVKDTTGNR